ncbi:MAG: GyrI-like domain-containing protein [Streptococcaceae bacterium]|jgi:hypothetical protein|nr:GyrI-like domain-containing protein [Streptococcaceae bacterium]
MTYTIQTINAPFQLTAYGVSFDDFNDWAGNAKKTAELMTAITADGSLDKLLAAGDGVFMQINSAAQGGKPWRGFGVKGDIDMAGTVKIAIHAQEHAVFSKVGADKASLADQLTGEVFGGAMREMIAAGYQYKVEDDSMGYNFTTVTENTDGSFTAEMWIPVVKG